MEQIDFSKVLLNESKFYNASCTYVSVFKKYSITNLEQLFNDELISQITYSCRPSTVKQIELFISMNKYEYLGIPLSNCQILGKRIIAKNNRIYFMSEDNKEDFLNIGEFFGLPNSYIDIFQKNIIRCFEIMNCESKEIRLVDLFKYILSNRKLGKSMKSILETYVDSYEKDQEVKGYNKEELKILSDQLKKLLDERDDLDIKIQVIQSKIDNLSNNKTLIKK